MANSRASHRTPTREYPACRKPRHRLYPLRAVGLKTPRLVEVHDVVSVRVEGHFWFVGAAPRIARHEEMRVNSGARTEGQSDVGIFGRSGRFPIHVVWADRRIIELQIRAAIVFAVAHDHPGMNIAGGQNGVAIIDLGPD